MARMRVEQPAEDADDDGRSGWAHWERTGSAELEFVGWCPAELGMCERKDVRHGWKSNKSRPTHLRVRSNDDE